MSLTIKNVYLIDLNPDEYNHGLRYYPVMVDLDSCDGLCNTLDDTCGRIRVQTKHVNVNLFSI